MNIIVVDDEPLALADLKRAIEKAAPECAPHCFASPLDALSYSQSKAPDIAFLDIKMNDVNGLSLAAKLKECNPKTNIIFVTGYSDYARERFPCTLPAI